MAAACHADGLCDLRCNRLDPLAQPGVRGAGFVNGLGTGIVLPAMVTWNARMLPVSRRGMGIGAFQSCFNLGMFLNPLMIVGLEKQLVVPRAEVVSLFGWALVALAVVALPVGMGNRRG